MTTEFYQKLLNSNILQNLQSPDLANARLADVPYVGCSSYTMKQSAMGDWLDPVLKSAQRGGKKIKSSCPFRTHIVRSLLLPIYTHARMRKRLVRSTVCVCVRVRVSKRT